MYEGTPDTADAGPLVGDHRALQGDHPLHRADHDPHLHEVGRGPARRPRSVQPAPARVGRRAHQPRGVDLVPHPHRRRALPDRRHLVADRDRRHPHHAAARDHRHQAGRGHDALPRHSAPTSSTTRAIRSATARAATWSSPSPGRGCCAASRATTSATRRRTGRGSRAATSPATGPSGTRTATCGCWAGSTTS